MICLPMCMVMEDALLAEGHGHDDPVGEAVADDATSHPAGGAAETQRPAGELAPHARREQLDPLEVTRLAGPLVFVRFVAVEQVVLGGALLDRALDRERHRDEPDALLGEPGIEASLVEGERPAVLVAMQRRRRSSVQSEDEEPQPAALEAESADVGVEGAQRGGGERLRSTALAPASVVEIDEYLQRLAALFLRGRPLETDVELLRQVLQPPLNVVPVGGAERGQVRRPGVAGQLDEGADVDPGGRGGPAQPPREVAGELRGGADVRGNVAELQDGP